MKRRLTGRDAEAILAGTPVDDGDHSPLRATISALRGLEPPTGGPAAESRAVATFMANRIGTAPEGRVPMITRVLASKLALALGIGAMATTGSVAAAAVGVLPAPAQNLVSGAAAHLGVSLPNDQPSTGDGAGSGPVGTTPTPSTTESTSTSTSTSKPTPTSTPTSMASVTATNHPACPSGLAINSMNATITSDGYGVFLEIKTTGTFPYMSAGGTGWTGSVSPVSDGWSGTLHRSDGSSVAPGTPVYAGSCEVRASTTTHDQGQSPPEPTTTTTSTTTTTVAPSGTTTKPNCPSGLAINSMNATITSDGYGVFLEIKTTGTFPYMSAGGTGWTGSVSPVSDGWSGTLHRSDGSSVAPGTPVYAGSCGVRASTTSHYEGQSPPQPTTTTTSTTTTTVAPSGTTTRDNCPSGLAINSMDATINPGGKGVVVTIGTSGTFPYMSAGGTGWTGTVSPVSGGWSGTLTRSDGGTVVAGTPVYAGACGVRASTQAHS